MDETACSRARLGIGCRAVTVRERLSWRYNRAVLFSSPLLRTINLSIAVLLIAVLAGAYRYAWRTLPETSGSISAPTASKATIARDRLGIPHINAGSIEDAI